MLRGVLLREQGTVSVMGIFEVAMHARLICGEVIVNVKDALDLLPSLKIDHYTEPEGLKSCPKVSVDINGLIPEGQTCDCGADEHNEKVDVIIAQLDRAIIGVKALLSDLDELEEMRKAITGSTEDA